MALSPSSALRRLSRPRVWLMGGGIVIVLLGIDCLTTNFVAAMFHDPAERFGRGPLDIMLTAERVEVIRLQPWEPVRTPATASTHSSSKPMDQPLFGGTVIGDPKMQDDAWRDRARALIASARSYQWSVHKACLPRPGVALRFHHGEQVVDFLICFECDMVTLGLPGQHMMNRWADSDPARSALLELVKEALPNDAVIQRLQ